MTPIASAQTESTSPNVLSAHGVGMLDVGWKVLPRDIGRSNAARNGREEVGLPPTI